MYEWIPPSHNITLWSVESTRFSALEGLTNRREKPCGVPCQDVHRGSYAGGLRGISRVIERGQKEKPDCREHLLHLPSCFEAGQKRQREIQEDQIGLKLPRRLHQSPTFRHCADHLVFELKKLS